MIKRIIILLATGAALCVFLSLPVVAQSNDEAIRIPEDAYAPKEKPRSEGEPRREAAQLEEALKTYTKAGDDKQAGLTYLRLGRVYEGLRQFEKVGECYEKALATFTKMGDTMGEAQALSNLGWLRWKFGEFDEAVEFYEKALEGSKKIGDEKGEARALYGLGHLCHEQYEGERLSKAVGYYEKALAIFTRISDVRSEGLTSSRLGKLYGGRWWSEKQPEFCKHALGFYEKAALASEKLGDDKGQAQALYDLAWEHSKLGQNDKAVQSCEKAMAISAKIGDATGERDSKRKLADLLLKRGQPGKAVTLYEKTIEAARNAGDTTREAQAFVDLGEIYKKQHQWQEAAQSYKSALALSTQISYAIGPPGPTRIMRDLAEVYVELGHYDEALAVYTKALQSLDGPEFWSDRGWVLESLAKTYKKHGQPDKALSPSRTALEAARKTGDRKAEAQALNDMGRIYYERDPHTYERARCSNWGRR